MTPPLVTEHAADLELSIERPNSHLWYLHDGRGNRYALQWGENVWGWVTRQVPGMDPSPVLRLRVSWAAFPLLPTAEPQDGADALVQILSVTSPATDEPLPPVRGCVQRFYTYLVDVINAMQPPPTHGRART